MFLWIRDQKWLPALFVSTACFLVLGGIDLLLQGPLTLVASLVLALSIFLSRTQPWWAIGLFTVGICLPVGVGLDLQISQLSATISLLLLAVFANPIQRTVGFIANLLVGSGVFFWYLLTLPEGSSFYGVELPTADAKIAIATAGFIAMIAINANAWFIGRLIYTRINHVGTDVDVSLLERKLVAAQVALAEQDKRFGIARDVSEILLEQTSANLVAAESGRYAVKTSPEIAERVIDSIYAGTKSSFLELRRLADLLSLQDSKAVSLPGIRDLNGLFISYRELGYEVNFREIGEQLNLTDGSSLVVYRVVADSLENTKKHAPVGTGIDIDFIWKEGSLQVLLKDNGEETSRRLSGDQTGYTVTEDQKALVEHITGPSLTAMAERVKLFEGTIEFTRVPGVGFNVSASFPGISKYARGL